MTHQLNSSVKKWANKHILLICLVFGSLGIAALYTAVFILPAPLQFSYSKQSTCFFRPTLLPGIHKTIDDSHFVVTNSGGIALGDTAIVTTNTCVTPTSTPATGNTVVAVAPFGGVLYRQHIAVATPESPKVSSKALSKPVPTTKSLHFTLAAADVVNDYVLKVGDDKSAICKAGSGAATLSCDIASLDLDQGKKYGVELVRTFSGKDAVKVLSGEIETLTATTVLESSVKPSEIVYSRPTELTFTTDKPIKTAKAVLTQDGAAKNITTEVVVNDRVITVKLEKELPREASYTIKIDKVEAVDGSSLADAYVVPFKTSGGPVVTGVSIGKSGVSAGATVIVTFDQDISDKQDISKLVTIAGGTATISRSGNQVRYVLRDMGLCTPFTLSIAKGVESKYDIASTNSWTYASRTVCYTTGTYGYSVKGRPLVAYYFGGSGPVTMYVGAIHGNEPSSSGLMKAWIDDLEANPNLYAGKRIVVVPTINPDGVISNTRTNARGVNLNRNFPTDGWTKDIKDTDGNHAGGGGETPLSEPEAKALANLSINLRPRLLLSFHAVGSLVVGDPGGYSAGYAARYASMVGYRNATGQSGTFDYDITGAYEDWTYTKQGIPSMVIELGSYGYFNFAHHREALRSMLN